jgi:pSer/pThr/pTyr-binding forkhead associated (FHA) protein
VAPLPAPAGFTPAAPVPRSAWQEPDSAFGDARTFSYAHAGSPRVEAAGPGNVVASPPTVTEVRGPVIPVLKLVTGGRVTQTRVSGARAGRGAVDLVLPEVPTVSREHAKFTFTDGQWWVSNLGRNGLTLNGAPVLDGGYAIRDGDSIQWGRRPDAPVSRIEIG